MTKSRMWFLLWVEKVNEVAGGVGIETGKWGDLWGYQDEWWSHLVTGDDGFMRRGSSKRKERIKFIDKIRWS